MSKEHGKSARRALRLWMAAQVLALAGAAAHAASVPEPPPAPHAGDILPDAMLQSAHHRVQDDVDVLGHFYRFVVESDLGTYGVTSLALLRERVHEIKTLSQAMVQYQRADKEFHDALLGQLQVRGDTIREIVGSPLQTAGSLAGQLTRNVGRTVTGESEVLREKSAEPMSHDQYADAQTRRMASQLGLDVYSSNSQVRVFLKELAQAHAAGRDTGLSSLSLSRERGQPVAGGILAAWIDSQIKNLTPLELNEDNGRRLAQIGVDTDLRRRFLTHPWLSPRHKTAITAYLEFLEGVQHRDLVVGAALTADSEAEAQAQVELARMLALYYDTIAPLAALQRAPQEGLLALTREGARLALLPVDTAYLDGLLVQMFEALEPAQERPAELVVAGMVSDAVQQRAREQGVKVREGFLFGM